MNPTASLVEQADRVAAELETYLAELPTREWARPSDCPDWTVAHVAAHLVGAATGFAESVQRGLVGESGPPPEAAAGLEAYRAYRAQRLEEQAALSPSELLAQLRQALVTLRWALLEVATDPPPSGRGWHSTGQQPLPWFAGHWLVEVSLHDWDIRVAADPDARVNPAAHLGLGPLMRERLVRCYKPGPDLEPRGVVRIALDGEAPCRWLVRLAGASAEVLDDRAGRAQATIRTNPGTYALVQTSRRPAEIFEASGRWRVEGEAALAAALAAAFKGY